MSETITFHNIRY